MKNQFFSRLLSLTALLSLTVGVAIAGSVTIDSIETGETTSAQTPTISREFGDITLSFTRKSSNNPGFYTSKGILRYYASDVMTVSSAYDITKIEFTMYSGSAAPGTASPEGLTGSGTKYEWEGNAKSVSFTGGGTVKISTLVVTYSDNSSPADPGVTTNSVTWTCSTLGEATLEGPISGTINDYISFESAKGGGTTATAYNKDGTVRLYYDKSGGGDGSTFTLKPGTGVTITEVIINAKTVNYTPAVDYKVDGGAYTPAIWDGTQMTISNIAATSAFTFKNANKTNTQLQILSLEITYTLPATGGGDDPEDPTLGEPVDPVAGFELPVYHVYVNGYIDMPQHEALSSGTVTHVSADTSVAEIGDGVINAGGVYGQSTLVTATIAETNEYASASASYVVKVVPTTVDVAFHEETSMLPYSNEYHLDFSENKEITVYAVSQLYEETKNDKTYTYVVLNPVESGHVPAVNGVFMIGKKATTYEVPVLLEADAIEANYLVASLKNEAIPASDGKFVRYCYHEETGKFCRVNEDGTLVLPPVESSASRVAPKSIDENSAYVEIPAALAATLPDVLSIAFYTDHGIETGVQTITIDAETTRFYNLLGQPVSPDHRGIILSPGHKTLHNCLIH